MNRSILIVICDFLLVSLLAFSTTDVNKLAEPGGKRVLNTAAITNQVEAGSATKDLTAAMQLALSEERKGREQLLGELAKARDDAAKQQALVSERQRQIENVQQALTTKEQQAAQLQQEQTNLQAQYAAAQANIQGLNQQLQNTSTEAVLSKEKLAAMEAEAKKQAEQAAALQQQLAQLAKSNQMVLSEKQLLANQLQVAEVERRHASEQAVRMQEEVKIEREEKAKLAEGVKVLANKSSELAEQVQQVRESTPLAPNTIFNDFVTNRVAARFNAYRPSLLGIDSSKNRETETVLVSDGTNTVALCHVQDTPLTFWDPGIDWQQLSGTLSHNANSLPVRSLGFHLQDPRIVLISVNASDIQRLGCKVYRTAPNPFKFQDAVLVGAREGYYGECRFEMDLSTPDYLKLDHNFLKGLFGKFNPTRGDLVFSRTGELLGVMANSTYCLVLRNFDSSATLRCGMDVRDQHTGVTLSMLYSRVAQMPFKLQ